MRFTEKEWRLTHFEELSCGSDRFYAAVCAKLMDAIKVFLLPKLPEEFNTECLQYACINATAYLEDIVTGLGIWNAFRSECRKRYGYTLPFYNVEAEGIEYFDDEVNLPDVKFIIWSSVSRQGQPKGIVYNPESEFINKAANIIYPILAKAWETAPETMRMKKLFMKTLESKKFLEVRKFLEWLLTKCYLTSDPNFLPNLVKESEMSDSELLSSDLMIYASLATSSVSRLLAPIRQLPQVYAAAIARELGLEKGAERIAAIDCAALSYFEIIEVEKEYVTLRLHERLNSKSKFVNSIFRVTKHSVATSESMKLWSYLITTLAKFEGVWHVNGMMIHSDEIEQKSKENDIPQITEEQAESTKREFNTMVEKLGGRMVFLPSIKKANKLIGIKGNREQTDLFPSHIYVFVHENGVVEFGQNGLETLKSSENPYYKPRKSKDGSLALNVLCGNESMSYEVLKYAVEQGMLADATIYASQGHEFGHRMLQDNIYFFLDYYNSSFEDDSENDEI